MSLSERDIYERVARKELSVEAAMELLARLELQSSAPDAPRPTEARDAELTSSSLHEQVFRYLETRLRQVLQLHGEIPADSAFMSLGASSASLLSATQHLERALGMELFPTLFFEHPTLDALATYFAESHGDRMRALLEARPVAPEPVKPRAPVPAPVAPPSPREQPRASYAPSFSGDIAIVGVSGRYPGARNLEEYWRVLSEGRDCITEIPRERWDWERYFHPVAGTKGTAISKWGGFVEDADMFDPLFFNISPREAEILDPQERLFLQTAWSALEDAGYARAGLRRSGIAPEEAGVFVGVMWDTYQLHGPEQVRLGHEALPVAAHWVIANRVSYFFDFQGPSMAVDTACSSSLTALHLACESLRSGECRLALAGGVNLSTHPYKYLTLGNWRFLSGEGRCRSFGEGGDGYVPGEGVGAVVLRRLEDAERDGDPIYAVIKGTALNHGGRANGFTVPNPNAQAALIRRALKRADVDPATISYVEAHGTGTSLGDPIEMAGLHQAFQGHLTGIGVCPMGSVKSNIGHLEAAAGIAALTKVLLQLEHQTLAPSLHSTPLNPAIDFDNSPFHVVTALTPWRRPVLANGQEAPRRATVSSFGAGGSNGHVVIEEYVDTRRGAAPAPSGRELILLSAKNRERLREYAAKLRDALETYRPPLSEIAHTLQVGREAMPDRLALIVRDHEDLRSKLAAFVAGDERAEQVYISEEATKGPRLSGADAEDRAYVASLFERGKLERLAAFWTSGSDIDWAQLRPNGGRRIPLPGYPFARERFWFETTPAEAKFPPPRAKQDAGPSGLVERCFGRVWQEAPLTEAAQGPLNRRRLIILHDASASASFREHLLSLAASERHVVEVGRVSRSTASGRPALARDDFQAAAALARELVAEAHGVDGLLDLCDLTRSDDGGQVHPGRMGFYQGLLAGRDTRSLLLLHVTAGLLSGETLTGAPIHGLVTALSGEYRGVTVRSVDVEHADLPPEHLFALLAQEATDVRTPGTDARQARYRKGRREALTLRELPLAQRLQVSPDKTYVISGGTRGLGAGFARMLVERGARKLALLGAQTLPPRAAWQRVAADESVDGRKVRALLELEARGAEVRVYTGPLLDRGALRRFFDDVRSTLGPVAGVLHCAGTVSDESPAFLHKSPEGIGRVLEPKLGGTQVLADLLEDDQPDFFVLFSSVASIVPNLAVGLSDYALANAFLDRFAEYQHRHGRTGFRALNWPSFRDAGFGETTTAAYRGAQLAALSVEQGFSLFERVLGIDNAPVVLPCLAASDFDASTLLASAASSQAPRPATPASAPRVASDASAKSHAFDALLHLFAAELKLDPARLKGDVRFEEYGVDSVLIASAVKQIETLVGAPIEPGFLLEYPTLGTLSAFLAERHPSRFVTEVAAPSAPVHSTGAFVQPPVKHHAEPPRPPSPSRATVPIAIVGMACRFPGGADTARFWETLAHGTSAIREVPTERWDAGRFYSPQPGPGRTNSKWGGFVDGIDLFDPAYFRISESFAIQMDPLQRLMLETSLLATLDAGYSREELSNRKVGVYIGARTGAYPNRIEQPEKSTIVGIGQNFIGARISDYFNWRGNNLVIDTACSSSLVSVHLACQALREGEIEAALAGGVDLILDELPYLTLSAAGALSPDGRCHTFDERANGFVPGEGAGALLLKRLDDALRDGDRIHAVIRGSAVNNDGRTMGITTPNMEAQVEVIEAALAKAGVTANTLSYVEAHGTGTMIGDPIELKALATVFKRATEARGFCAVGSVKTNIGHLLSAAGIAGLVKTALALDRKQLPPTLHCERPNPRFAFSESPFYVNRDLRDWHAVEGHPRRAGISAFGFGGTNCHMVLEERPDGTEPGRAPLPAPAFSKQRYLLPARPRNEARAPAMLRFEPIAPSRVNRVSAP
ncbi:Malonyl CoA-acyl carrier protein transacylase [Myxococcus hansupus]|uniref:Malonyl CoA-acyl carrier protein transacylase n=1 Tax=Pseudomyxococcus hansupus TaxID=1297742 RepID=A0A0H4WWR9_9BACT|nr:beta-ketoacyl synthase N-terminal-like domain-containing protein [Myxococcus hansupus]AKQ65800.1 Malonyl CoA-acyl carrier protein transacylase [Myxococcus hansupus]